MHSHPYASAYSSLPNPFQPSPLHNETTFDSGYSREPPIKRSRPSESGSINQADSRAPSEMGDDDDEDDDDDDEDGDGQSGKGGKKGGKGGKGADGKGKVKLTRGSR